MNDLAIVGASIRTLDPARPHASAVAVRDGIVIAVGDAAEVREHAGAATELVDGRGIALVPGLVDSHIHPFHGTDGTRGADLGGPRTLDEIRGALAAERARCAPGEWVLGWGLSYDAFHGERIGADAIAGATGDAPVLVSFFDYHSALASRPALALAGVDGARDFGAGAAVVCDDAGVPTRAARRCHRTGGARRADVAVRRAGAARAEDERRGDRGAARAARSRRAPLARGRGEVLHRRRDRHRHGVAVRAGSARRGDPAVLARPHPLRRGRRAIRARRLPVRDARDRRPCRGWRDNLLPEQVAAGFRWADVRRSGAILALGSDWPVASADPRPGLAWARLRREPGRPERIPFLPDQALTAMEALEGYTTEAARALGEEHVSGRIAPGMRADFTGLGADPVECSPDELPDVPVRLTVVDGEIVFRG